MGTSTLFAALALLAATACNAASIGVVSMNIGSETYLHSLVKLSQDDLVHFQYPDEAGTTRCCISRRSKSFLPIESASTASDALTGEPVFSYKLLSPLRLKDKVPFVGAAVVGHGVKVQQRTRNSSLKVASPAGTLTVRTCTSQEGLHVLGESGARLVSDLYVGFDYEVETPTCRR
jgi:hypothetical protein